MCGIAGIHFLDGFTISKKKTEDLIDTLLMGIEERGRHATGVATMNKNAELWIEKGDIKASDFVMWRRNIPNDSHTILLHTRYATQGSPKLLENNHPVEYDSTVIIHNGHINNDSELFRTENLSRKAEVDSEIIAALINKYGLEKANVALSKLDGNYAIAAMDQRNPKTLVLAKGFSSPLEVTNIDGMIVWASTFMALKNAVKNSLGYDLSITECKSLKLGDLLFVEDGSHEYMSFKPLEKKYYSSGYTSQWDKKSWWKKDNKPAGFQGGEKKDEKKKDSVEYEFCSFCFAYEPTEYMWTMSNLFVCEECFEEERSSREKAEIENSQYPSVISDDNIDSDDEYEYLNDEHWAICELVAEEFQVTKEIVDKILFEDELMDEEDSMTVSFYLDVSIRYDELYDELVNSFSFLDNTRKEKKQTYVSDNGRLIEYSGWVGL